MLRLWEGCKISILAGRCKSRGVCNVNAVYPQLNYNKCAILKIFSAHVYLNIVRFFFSLFSAVCVRRSFVIYCQRTVAYWSCHETHTHSVKLQTITPNMGFEWKAYAYCIFTIWFKSEIELNWLPGLLVFWLVGRSVDPWIKCSHAF